MLLESDFTEQFYLSQKNLEDKQRIQSYIAVREPMFWVELLTEDGYEEYLKSLEVPPTTAIDFTELEERIKPAFVRLMHFEMIQDFQVNSSANGYLLSKLENATQTINEGLLCRTHNDGVRIWNNTIDWLTNDQTAITVYNSVKKQNVNVFGI